MGPTDEELWLARYNKELWRARQVQDLDGWIPWQQLNDPDANRPKLRRQNALQKRNLEGDRELLAIAEEYCPEGEQVSPYPGEL